MFVRHDTRKVLVVGLLILAAVQQAVSAQETTANVPDGPQCRTWTDRSGKHRTEASFVEAKDGKVTLKKKDGATISVPLESLSNADREYVGTLSKTPPEEHGIDEQASAVPKNRTGKESLPQADETIVTGVGTDPDKAVQNAFSQAIEQVVGLLVDSETAVRNDQLIHDEILTFSRGYVEKYEVIRRWQENGLHHARIRAVVARDKLVAKLRGIRIATREVSGDLPSRQFEFDARNEEQAGIMFKKAMADFDMTKLTKVDIVGKPEITRDSGNAKVHVKIKVSPDMDAWRKFSQSVRPILAKIAVRRAALTQGHNSRSSDAGLLKRQLEGDGILVALFVNMRNSGQQKQWEVFRVPDTLKEAIESKASGVHCRLVCALQDDQHNDLARITVMRNGHYYDSSSLGEVLKCHQYEYPLTEHIWWASPGWRQSDRDTVFQTETTMEISLEDLGRLAQAVAFLEEDTKSGGRSDMDNPFGGTTSPRRTDDDPFAK